MTAVYVVADDREDWPFGDDCFAFETLEDAAALAAQRNGITTEQQLEVERLMDIPAVELCGDELDSAADLPWSIYKVDLVKAL